MKRRVVVTGMGVVTPLGNTVSETWDGIVNGRSGIRPIEQFDVSAYGTRFGGSIRDFDANTFLPPKEVRKFDDFILYGLGAAVQAMEDAGLVVEESFAPRVGAAIGSGIGGIASIEKSHQIVLDSGPRRVSPFFVPGSITNMIAGYLSIRYGFSGPNLAITTACTTGTHNIGMGARLIAWGEVDAMIVGGSEMATTPVGLGGFSASRALSTRNDAPEAASRPWDRDRDGFVLSDGAGVLVLEELEFARRRGARIYAELIGFGMSGDAYHMTLPPEDGRGAAAAMHNAIRDAGVTPQEIDYINAHGTSTPAGDLAESRAVQRVLGDAAGRVAMQLDQVHDRSPARRRWRGGGGVQHPGDPRRGGAADDQPRQSRRGLHAQLRAPRRSAAENRHRAVELLRVRRDQRLPGLSQDMIAAS